MKKTCKKIISAISAGVLCALPLIQNTQADAYYSGQQHTWRLVEKATVINMTEYTSITEHPSTYTFGSCKKGNLCEGTNFSSSYLSWCSSLVCTITNNQTSITGSGYLSISTWYTPVTVTSLSLDYSNNVGSNIAITPLYIMVGDVNNDKVVNTEDTKIISSYIMGNATLNERQKFAADVNNDNVIDLYDAIDLEKFVAGDISRFE